MRPFPPRGNLVLVAAIAAFAASAAAACVQFPDDPIAPVLASADAWVSPWEEDDGSMKLVKPIGGLDGGAPTPDAWAPPDTRPPTYYDIGGTPPSSNSGKVCTPPYGCVTKVEECLPLGISSSKGMCLGKCSSPGSSCPVANPSTQLAACALQASPTEFYCVYFCAVQGQTFACPDAVNYSCEAPDPTQPSMKVCVPK